MVYVGFVVIVILSLIVSFNIIMVIDLIYIIFGFEFWVDVLFFMYFDVFFFLIDKFCMIVFIFVFNFSVVKELLVLV